MAVTLRDAEPADAGAIATVHVAAWRETYAGLLPEEMLAGISVEAREAMWTRILANSGGTLVFVAEDGGRVVGFGSCGDQRDQGLRDLGFTAEISAIYLLRPHQRQGLGAVMMRRMAHALAERGQEAGALWVLRENLAARRFYERLAGAVVAEKEEQRPQGTLFEVAYGWRRLADLG